MENGECKMENGGWHGIGSEKSMRHSTKKAKAKVVPIPNKRYNKPLRPRPSHYMRV